LRRSRDRAALKTLSQTSPQQTEQPQQVKPANPQRRRAFGEDFRRGFDFPSPTPILSIASDTRTFMVATARAALGVNMSYPEDSPAAIASLSVIREILIVLRDKGILTSNDIVDAINKADPGITAESEFDKMVYRACLWLKTPHLAESLQQILWKKRISENSN
jgi:hypothetical protein